MLLFVLLPQGQKIRKDMFFVIVHISQICKNNCCVQSPTQSILVFQNGAFQSGSNGVQLENFICLIFLKNIGLKVIFNEDTAVFSPWCSMGLDMVALSLQLVLVPKPLDAH